MSTRIASVVGARPQFVKAAAFSSALDSAPEGSSIEHHLIHTGQHYDEGMSGVFFRDLGLGTPDFHLGVGSGTHGFQTGEMMKALEPILEQLAPDVVLVYGDTNSTLAAALVAAKQGVPVAHVEAGLRSGRRSMPEEINRVVTDHLSAYLFCPSESAAQNCRNEGIEDGVEVVGDIMLDALEHQRHALPPNPAHRLGLRDGEYALATIHRAENTSDHSALAGILDGLVAVAARGLAVVLPLHPRTRPMVDAAHLTRAGVFLLEPQPFPQMVALEAGARVVLTDSGGVQKEALWLGVPCVTLRTETEWVETVEVGWNRLAGANARHICEAALAPAPQGRPPRLYGDGRAARRILRRLGGVGR